MCDSNSATTLSFIILTWNSEGYIKRCFDSIIQKCSEEELDFEVIVVDNGSHDCSCDLIKEYQKSSPESFHLIKLETNRGTTYTRNLGLKHARGEYICILDSDTEFGVGRLEYILSKLKSDQQIGIIVPQLLLPDGEIQHSVKRFPTMLDKLLKVPRILFGINTANVDFYPDFPFANERNVESAISACWFFRRELLDIVGYLDEKIFYAPEDVEYCLRTWKKGLTIVFSPMLTVFHHTQQISHKKPFSKTARSHFCGLLYFFRKHGGWFFRVRFY